MDICMGQRKEKRKEERKKENEKLMYLLSKMCNEFQSSHSESCVSVSFIILLISGLNIKEIEDGMDICMEKRKEERKKKKEKRRTDVSPKQNVQ